MARTYQAISGDGHLEVPPQDWAPWVLAKYKDRMPRLVKLEDGGEGWLLEGMPLTPCGPEIAGDDPPEKLKWSGTSYWKEDGVTRRPGLGTPQDRLRQQDLDGIDAEVLFPPVFASGFIRYITERNVHLAMVQAYNTFLAEGYCSVAPDRLIGMAVVPTTGIDDAITEMKRCKELGLRAVSLKEWPNGSGQYQPEDDRFFETALETGMRLSPHIAFGAGVDTFIGDAPAFSPQSDADRLLYLYRPDLFKGCTSNIAQLIYHGVFDRIPQMQIYFGESHAGWVPYWLQMAQQAFDTNHFWYEVDNKKPIGEYVREHVLFGFVKDELAVKNRDYWSGTDNIIWGSDFPHQSKTHPHSQKFLEKAFEGVPASVRRQVLVENACRFFGLDPEKPLTPTPEQ